MADNNSTINFLCLNAGRRATLLKNLKQSLGDGVKIVATDNWSVAPALFFADNYYITKKINENGYMEEIFNICEKEKINVIATLIDPEIALIAKHKEEFKKRGILPLVPSYNTAQLCFDKYKMYEYLKENNIPTPLTFNNPNDFYKAYENKEISFPVFIKPITGSGSVGAQKIETQQQLQKALNDNQHTYIIQEYMDCGDIDTDVYIDCISGEIVSIFSKKKIETRIGGASKTISFIDSELFDFILNLTKKFDFSGAIDVDLFYKNGKYYLNEINPRFGGAYLHAFGAGVDFFKYIKNNCLKIENKSNIGDYKKNILMLMYDEVVITSLDNLKKDFRD